MKKFLIIVITAIILPLSALAVDVGTRNTKEAANTGGYKISTNDTTFSETLGSVIKLLLSTVGIFFLALTVYAGILWMTSHGEEEQTGKAQKIIRAAVIGLIIVVGSYALANYVMFRV
jgi:hypothetical protein